MIRTLAALAAAGAGLTLPAGALANQTAVVACDGYRITFTGYPDQTLRFDVELQVDGDVTVERVELEGPTAELVRSRQIGDGQHEVTVAVTRLGVGFGRRELVASASVSCGAPTTTPPAPPTTTPPEPPTPPAPPTTTPPEPPTPPAPPRIRRPRPIPPVVTRRPRPLPSPTVCRVYVKRPANAVGYLEVPRPGEIRVRRDGVTARWTGFRGDRFVRAGGRVVFRPGSWCGRVRTVAVTG